MRTLTFKLLNGEVYSLQVEEENDRYWWEEGNMSCDCNRMLSLVREYPTLGPYEDPMCGDTIELIGVDPPWKETE